MKDLRLRQWTNCETAKHHGSLVSVHLVLYFNREFNLYELIIAEYLAFHMELQKRGMATIQSGQKQILLFFPIIRSVPS